MSLGKVLKMPEGGVQTRAVVNIGAKPDKLNSRNIDCSITYNNATYTNNDSFVTKIGETITMVLDSSMSSAYGKIYVNGTEVVIVSGIATKTYIHTISNSIDIAFQASDSRTLYIYVTDSSVEADYNYDIIEGKCFVGYGEPQTRAVINLAENASTYWTVTYNNKTYKPGNKFIVNIGETLIFNIPSTDNGTPQLYINGETAIWNYGSTTYKYVVQNSLDITFNRDTIYTKTDRCIIVDSTTSAGVDRKILVGKVLINGVAYGIENDILVSVTSDSNIKEASNARVIINEMTYYPAEAASFAKVKSGDTITLTCQGMNSSYVGKVTIDGEIVAQSSRPISSASYNWVVPFGLSNISIQFVYVGGSNTTGSVTVTTS